VSAQPFFPLGLRLQASLQCPSCTSPAACPAQGSRPPVPLMHKHQSRLRHRGPQRARELGSQPHAAPAAQRACVHACVRACVCTRERACMSVCVYVRVCACVRPSCLGASLAWDPARDQDEPGEGEGASRTPHLLPSSTEAQLLGTQPGTRTRQERASKPATRRACCPAAPRPSCLGPSQEPGRARRGRASQPHAAPAAQQHQGPAAWDPARNQDEPGEGGEGEPAARRTCCLAAPGPRCPALGRRPP